jgi:hypothetical protein
MHDAASENFISPSFGDMSQMDCSDRQTADHMVMAVGTVRNKNEVKKKKKE